MSKIALTPNASGTGVFTIASPATSTNRTLTLPDQSGTVLTGAGPLTVNASAPNQAVTVDASGNVGIGTTSPVALSGQTSLTINGTSVGRLDLQSTGTLFGNGTNFILQGSYAKNVVIDGGTTAGIQFQVGSSEKMRIDSSGRVGIGRTPTLSNSKLEVGGADNVSLINVEASGVTGGMGIGSTGLQFFHGSSAKMRIDSSGNLLVGATSNPSAGKVVIDYARGVSAGMRIKDTVAAGGTGVIADFYNASNASVGAITHNSSSTAYNTSSDYRLKTDAQPMVGASDRVLALKPVNFEWISSGDRVDGFLAHEAQAVVPECVTGTKDAMRDEEYEVTAAVYEDIIIAAVLDEEGNELEAERTEQRLVTEAVMGTRSVPDMQGIDQSKLVPLLTAALQEALTEISALKVRVAALEAV